MLRYGSMRDSLNDEEPWRTPSIQYGLDVRFYWQALTLLTIKADDIPSTNGKDESIYSAYFAPRTPES